MLIVVQRVDVRRIRTPWKLVSEAGLALSTRESPGKTKTGRISKQGSPWLAKKECAMTAVRYDQLNARISSQTGILRSWDICSSGVLHFTIIPI